MNSDSENLSSSGANKDLSDLQPVSDLIDLLLDQETSQDDFVSERSVENFDLLPEDQDSAENVNFSNQDLEILEIEVEIESESKPSLKESVEYKAFLQQTVEPTQSEVENIDSMEKVAAIDTTQASTEDLASAVNSLIPLIVELLQFKLNHSREGVIQTIRPVIDQLIEHRIKEDSPKMAAAIAKILPSAITEKINLDPETIANAIAPEIALSIREQIRLDQDAIPQVLGPEMGKAIKAQIESERDAMVDALYPVIGSTISKYMVEVVQDINRKVESTISPEGIKRKFQAKMQGVSEAELIFKESVGYHVRAIFLIDKNSGLIIQEIQLPGDKHLDSDMLAGMLTAIRSFANDCISSGSELDLIDYGDWQIPLEVAGYCYLAVVVAGEPPRKFTTKIRQVLGEIILEHDEAIQNFNGNLANVPTGVRAKLEKLTQVDQDQPQKSPPFVLWWVLIYILGLVLIPWGILNYRAKVADNIEQITATQLDAAPELSVYRLDSKVKSGKLIVSGRVSSEYLRIQASEITQEIANRHNLQLDNQIVTVNVPVNPSLVTGEIQRLTRLFNQQSQVAIETKYQPPVLNLKGFVLDESTYQTISQSFSQIPGIEQIIFNVSQKLPIVVQRIYFVSGSSELDFADNFSKINAVEELLQQYPQLNLKLTGHSDGIGASEINQQLAKERCQNVKAALVSRGVDSNRLVADCDSLLLTKNTDNNQATWSKRYVSFEPFISPN